MFVFGINIDISVISYLEEFSLATHKSAIKRHKQSLRNQVRNRAVKTRLKNVIKDVRLAVQQQDKDVAAQALRTASSFLTRLLPRALYIGKMPRARFPVLPNRLTPSSH